MTGGAAPPAPYRDWPNRADPPGVEWAILATIADVDAGLADLFTPWPCICGRVLPVGSGLGGLCPECSTVANL